MSTPELLKNEVEVFMPDGSSIIAPSTTSPYELKARWELSKLESELSAQKAKRSEAYKSLPFEQRRLDPDTERQLGQLEGEIQKRKSVIAKYEADAGGLLDKAGYHAKQIGSAALRGLSFTPALAASADKAMRTSDNAAAPVNAVDRIGLTPVTRNERSADTVIQAMTGGLAGVPRKALASTTALNAGVGAGVDLGYRIGGDENPLAGLAGGGAALAALLVPAYAKAPKEGMVRELLENVPENSLREAQKTQKTIQDSGLGSVNLSQAMQQPSGVDSLVNALATSRHGKRVQQQLNQQPLSASIAADDALARVPGDVRTPQQVANLEQEAATEVIKQTKKKAGQKYGEALPQDLELPPASVQTMLTDLSNLKKGLAPVEADLVDDVLASIRKPGVPTPEILTNAAHLDKQVRSALDSYGARKLNTPGLDATLGRIAEQVREVVSTATDPILGASKKAFSKVMTEEANPLIQSIVGRSAGKAGANDTVEAGKSKLWAALDKGVDPLAKGNEILDFQKQLSKVPNGNEAFQDSFKSWLSDKISKATRDKGGRTPEDAAKNLTKFFGDPRKPSHASKGMESALVALARSQGKPDDSLVKGIQHVQLFLSSASRRPGNVGDVDKDYMTSLKSDVVQGSLGTEAMQRNFIAKKFNEWRYEDAYKFFDDALTTPEGVDMLVEMAKSSSLSPRAAKTLSSFMALGAANTGEKPALPAELPK